MRRDRVAQLDSALDFESSGCGFKSRRGCMFFLFFCFFVSVCVFVFVFVFLCGVLCFSHQCLRLKNIN